MKFRIEHSDDPEGEIPYITREMVDEVLHGDPEWDDILEDPLHHAMVFAVLLARTALAISGVNNFWQAETFRIEDIPLIVTVQLVEGITPPERNQMLTGQRDQLYHALLALGAMPGGYCFCPMEREPKKLESEHTGECLDARAALDRIKEQG